MGQTPTKFPQELDAFGFRNIVTPHVCQWCGAEDLKCRGTCVKNFNNPYVAGVRNTRKKSRRKSIGSRKGSPSVSRRDRSPSSSSISNVSNAATESIHGNISPTSPETALAVPKSVHIPIEEQALCYFLANWVLLPRQGRTGGYMEYIIPLYSTCKPGSHLHYALSAASLAAFGNRPSCRQTAPSESVSAKASLLYAKALESTNKALRDPLLVKEDETLAAVLMLGFFETLTTYRSQTAWGSHNEGAIALVKLRGPDNLKTKAGQILFAAVRTQTLIKCMSVQKPYDKSIDWTAKNTFRDSGNHGITELNMILIELRADCSKTMTAHSRMHDPDHTQKVLELLSRARAAKAAFISWTKTRTDFWTFGPTAIIESLPPGTNLLESEVFPGRIDVYHELWIASIWNMGRTAALLFSSLIVRCAAWLSPQIDFRTLPEYREASRFDRKLVEDMIASVPFLLGWHKRQSRRDFLVHPEDQGGHPSLSGFACGDEEQGKALGGYFSMWPLFVAASSDFSSEAESRWIYGRLRFISDYMGIRQANFFASAKIRIPSMAIHRDKLELSNIPSPQTTINPSNYLEKSFLQGQNQDSSLPSSLGLNSGNVTSSPNTCSTASPETMFKADHQQHFVAAQ